MITKVSSRSELVEHDEYTDLSPPGRESMFVREWGWPQY